MPVSFLENLFPVLVFDEVQKMTEVFLALCLGVIRMRVAQIVFKPVGVKPKDIVGTP